jgi:signal transduction histidine kinase
MSSVVRLLVDWPLVASMALAMTAQGLRAGRRRGALNEALHEVRRPLQALALASGPRLGGPPQAGHPVQLAASALERLEREINGGPPASVREEVCCQPLLEAAVARWRARATIGGGSLQLRWRAGLATLVGDRVALAQALDNLIVNAIEHGGPEIAVEARRRGGRLRISVADSGRALRPESRRDSPAEVIARLSGRRRHGHGLAVVRRTAAGHGGRFVLRRSERGSVAILDLPLRDDPARERRMRPAGR